MLACGPKPKLDAREPPMPPAAAGAAAGPSVAGTPKLAIVCGLSVVAAVKKRGVPKSVRSLLLFSRFENCQILGGQIHDYFVFCFGGVVWLAPVAVRIITEDE